MCKLNHEKGWFTSWDLLLTQELYLKSMSLRLMNHQHSCFNIFIWLSYDPFFTLNWSDGWVDLTEPYTSVLLTMCNFSYNNPERASLTWKFHSSDVNNCFSCSTVQFHNLQFTPMWLWHKYRVPFRMLVKSETTQHFGDCESSQRC